MARIAVLGAGAGGAAAAVELTLAGHAVALWDPIVAVVEPFRVAGWVGFDGVLGTGRAAVEAITFSLEEALEGADVVLVCMPALGHEHVAGLLSPMPGLPPIILNPGQTGSALRFDAIFRAAGAARPRLAEFSTLTYVARKYTPDCVTISGVAKNVRVACLPGGEEALNLACELYRAAVPQPDVLATALSSVNLVLHPPGALLGAAWVEATGGDFRFYVDGVTPGVVRVMEALDGERRAVALAFGHELPSLIEEMAAVGTAEPVAAARGDFAAAITGGAANAEIRAPKSLEHRFYREDLGFGLVPFLALADAAGVDAPLARSLVVLGSALVGVDLAAQGLDAERLGIAGLDRDGILELVREGLPR